MNVASLFFGVALLASSVVSAAMPATETVALKPLNGSGEAGTAVITQRDGGIGVVVSLTGAPQGIDQPTHIHLGPCGADVSLKYALHNTVDGHGSSFVRDVTIADLKRQRYSINVHKSTNALGTYVACGNVTT